MIAMIKTILSDLIIMLYIVCFFRYIHIENFEKIEFFNFKHFIQILIKKNYKNIEHFILYKKTFILKKSYIRKVIIKRVQILFQKVTQNNSYKKVLKIS